MTIQSKRMFTIAITLAAVFVTLPLSPSGTDQGAASESRPTVGSSVPLVFNTPVSVSRESKGQIFNFSFAGEAGQAVSLTETSTIRPCTTVTLSIVRPDGTTFASEDLCGSSSLSNIVLPTTGQYSIVLDPREMSGPVTLTLTKKITRPIELNSPQVVNGRRAGQLFDLTFDGDAGERVSVDVTKNNYPCGAMSFKLLKPDGKPLASANQVCGDSTLEKELLPATGTYIIRVDPDISSGDATFTLSTVDQ